MKKVILILFLFATSLVNAESPASEKRTPGNVNTIVSSKNKLTDEEYEILIARLNEIQAMNFSSFDKNDKKELRKEVKSISDKLKESGVGIYLSLTAIIIILLLLLLL